MPPAACLSFFCPLSLSLSLSPKIPLTPAIHAMGDSLPLKQKQTVLDCGSDQAKKEVLLLPPELSRKDTNNAAELEKRGLLLRYT